MSLITKQRLDLKKATSPEWAQVVLKNFDEFLKDHAACERKASATCLSFVVKYRDRIELVSGMIGVAREELEHFEDVCRILHARNLILADDEKDLYVNQLLQLVGNGLDDRLLDRLLISGIIEARGCERFGILSEVLPDEELRKFYWKLSRAEAKHQLFFVQLAEKYFAENQVAKRLESLLESEGKIISQLPLRAALH